MQDLHLKAEDFLEKIINQLNELGFRTKDMIADHVCYRVESESEYHFNRNFLTEIGEELVESMVGGRKIATFRMSKPFCAAGQEVSILELPAPKASSSYKTGFEHVEFVISESFDEFVLGHSGLDFDFSGAKKKLNPDIRLKLPLGLSVKFHHLPLEEVIAIELGETP